MATAYVPKAGKDGKWQCSECTYINSSYSQKCEMCYKMRTKLNSDTSSQWLCKSCYFWNEQSRDKCFKCLTNRYNISNPVKKPPRLQRQTSKDDSDSPSSRSPSKSKNPAFKLFDKIMGKKGGKGEDVKPKPLQQADDLRSSLRAGDLILYQPDKMKRGINRKSDNKENQKFDENTEEFPKNKDKRPIPKSRKARRDKGLSGWIPTFKTKKKEVKKEPQVENNDTDDDFKKVKQDDLKSSFRAGDLIIWNPDNKFDKKFKSKQEVMKEDTDGDKILIPSHGKFKSPNGENADFVKKNVEKSENIWTTDVYNQIWDRKLLKQEKIQYPISDTKRKDDLRSSKRAGDLIIWDPVKKTNFDKDRDKKPLSSDKKDIQRVQEQKGSRLPPSKTYQVEQTSTEKETQSSKHQQIRNSIRKFDIKFKDKLKAFEQNEDSDNKPVFKDDLRSSRRAGDLFVWQQDKGMGAKPKVRPAMPQLTGIKTAEEGLSPLKDKKPVIQPRTSLKGKNEGGKDKNDIDLVKKSVKYHAVDNFVLKIVEDPIPKIKRKDDLRSSRSAGDLIIWQPDKMSHFRSGGNDVPKSKYTGKNISKEIPKIKNSPRKRDTPSGTDKPKTDVIAKIVDSPRSRDIPKPDIEYKSKNQDLDKHKSKEITNIPLTPLKPKTPKRNVVPAFLRQKSKDDTYQPEFPTAGNTPKSRFKPEQLIKGQEKDLPPKPKFKDDLRSSIRAGDLFIWDPDKKQKKKDDVIKPKTEQDSAAASQLKRRTPWTCKLCSSKNESDLKECHRCSSPKPDLLRKSRRSKILRKRELISRKSTKAVDVRKKEEQAAMAKWANIVSSCTQENKKFTDDIFPPELSSLYAKKRPSQKNPAWLRCQSLRNENKEEEHLDWMVYRKPTSPDDIMQGTLGNCWYLSALAVLAYREDLLEKIIVTKSFCPQGAYMVRLCKDGYWKIILIDDLFPCDQYDRLLYSKGKRKQLWVPLIEKAAAKLHGCYEALTSGRTIEALSLLTGEPCERLDLHENDDGSQISKAEKEKIWSKLIHARESGFLMGTSCGSGKMQNVDHEHYKQMGLISQHAYSLLDIQEVERNRLVRIRNPWGKESWIGNWCDKSSKWNGISSASKAKLQLDRNKDGIFWMDYVDFIRYFDSVDICKARRNWQELRLKGTFPPHAAQPWKFYKLGIIADTQLDIGLFQKNMRGTTTMGEPLVDLLIIVLEDTEDGFGFKQVIKHSRRALRSFVGCEVDLKPGKYTIACLAFKHWHTTVGVSQDDKDMMNRDFVLSIHSSMMIFTDEIDTQMIPGFNYLLADCVIQLCLDKGNRDELQPGLVQYSLSLGGGIFMIENTSVDKFARVKCDYSKSSYLIANRGDYLTKDCVPPGHRQILAVLSPLDSSMGWSSQRYISFLLHPKRGLQKEWAPAGVEHVPEITNELSGMYSPRPIIS